MIVRRLPIHPVQLAPTTLAQCQLVSNARSAGLSLSGLPPSLSLSLCAALSLSRKGGFGMSLSPPGFEPSSTKQKRCVVPTVLRGDAFCSVALSCSTLYLCLPLSLSLCLALCLALSSPPRPSFAPSPHPPQGFFLCLCCFLQPPACCPLSGISPFTRRCAEQRVEEPHGVSGYRVCLPEERSLE